MRCMRAIPRRNRIQTFLQKIFQGLINPSGMEGPVPVGARSKAYVCCRLPAEIVVSNPAGAIDFCVL